MKKEPKVKRLIAGITLAAVCAGLAAKAASNLVDFEFNEGVGSSSTSTKAGNLVGRLGRTVNHANDPVLSGDSPAQKAGERVDNPFTGSLDRLRIHRAFLSGDQLDSVAATLKAPLGSTVLAYNFNETALPCQSLTSPARPAIRCLHRRLSA